MNTYPVGTLNPDTHWMLWEPPVESEADEIGEANMDLERSEDQ